MCLGLAAGAHGVTVWGILLIFTVLDLLVRHFTVAVRMACFSGGRLCLFELWTSDKHNVKYITHVCIF